MNTRRHIRPNFVILAVLVVLLASATRLGMLQFVSPDAVAASSVAVTTTRTTASAATAQTASPTVTSAITPAPNACTPYGANTDPGGLNLATAPSGLTQSIEQPNTYRIYGNTAHDLERQITACAPKSASNDIAEFTAETSYRLTWSYTYTPLSGSDVCTLSSVKLGLHVGMVLPDWTPTAAASKSFVAQWQTFMTNLRTHENGHVVIDQQRAQALLAQLQNFAPTNCQTIATTVDSTINNAVAAINQANDQYDSTTNHGATQGAILP